MKAIYKSAEGERLVRERYQAFLKCWPVPNEQVHVPTQQGSTFAVISGPNGAPPLVLFHGGAFNSAMWMGDVPALARWFRVYCIDLIGEPGLSAPARPSLGSDAYAVWLDEVLRNLSIDHASIVGISLGGWLALDYAIRRPERVEKLAVLCPGGIGRQKVGIVFLTLFSRMFGAWGKRRLVEHVLGPAPANRPPAVKSFFDFFALIHRHFRPRMVKLPVFSGRDVLIDSAQTKRRLEQHAPKAQVVYLPETGHFITGQMARVLEFLWPAAARVPNARSPSAIL